MICYFKWILLGYIKLEDNPGKSKGYQKRRNTTKWVSRITVIKMVLTSLSGLSPSKALLCRGTFYCTVLREEESPHQTTMDGPLFSGYFSRAGQNSVYPLSLAITSHHHHQQVRYLQGDFKNLWDGGSQAEILLYRNKTGPCGTRSNTVASSAPTQKFLHPAPQSLLCHTLDQEIHHWN